MKTRHRQNGERKTSSGTLKSDMRAENLVWNLEIGHESVRPESSLRITIPGEPSEHEPDARQSDEGGGRSVDNVLYFVLKQSLRQFGDIPFVIGAYRRAAEVDTPLRLLYLSGFIGPNISWTARTK